MVTGPNSLLPLTEKYWGEKSERELANWLNEIDSSGGETPFLWTGFLKNI